jgi:uncharacterized membrane protein
MEEGEPRAWLRTHMALGPAFFGGLIAVAVWRASVWMEGGRVPWTYLGAMAALALLMTIQGYLGGELVYRFGAEVEGRYPRLPNERARIPRPEPGAPSGTA